MGKEKGHSFLNPGIQSYTLMELSVCVSVISIIALICISCYQHCLTKARLSSFYAKSKTLSQYHVIYYVETGIWSEDLHTHSWVDIPGNSVTDFGSDPHLASNFFYPSLSKYVSHDFFYDPFPDRFYEESILIATDKRELNKLFPFKEHNQNGFVLISRGPSLIITDISTSIGYNGLTYDTTNGTQSNGDVYVMIPQNSPPRFFTE